MELFESLINWATMIAVQQSTLGKRDGKKKDLLLKYDAVFHVNLL